MKIKIIQGLVYLVLSSSQTIFAQNFPIPETGLTGCYTNEEKIVCPEEYERFFGQDGNYLGREMEFENLENGVIQDLVTGLFWEQAHHDQRVGFYEARESCEGLEIGGFDDWRLPGIRELFSIADFSGSVHEKKAYVNEEYFQIEPPSEDILANDPYASTHHVDMMGQTWSSTIYAGKHFDREGVEAAFFFNFLDGRIKQAPTTGGAKLFYRCVRGQKWGEPDLVDQGDGTVIDKKSDLQWEAEDDGVTRNWRESIEYCENLSFSGYEDWRLPNVKELQSLVDYEKEAPAIYEPLFQSDPEGWFWSSTTHGDHLEMASYICFGKCVSTEGVDTHGAGAQRSDPKSGNSSNFGPMGGQRDEVRIKNYTRCVRGGNVEVVSGNMGNGTSSAPQGPPQGRENSISSGGQGPGQSQFGGSFGQRSPGRGQEQVGGQGSFQPGQDQESFGHLPERHEFGRRQGSYRNQGPSGNQSRRGPGSRGMNSTGPHGGPPPEALQACEGLQAGDSCKFTGRRKENLEGSCFAPEGRPLACRPDNHH